MTSKLLLKRSLAAIVSTAMVGAPATGFAQSAKAKRPHQTRPSQSRANVGVASLPAGTQRPTSEILLSIGEGQLITLPGNVANVWTSNPGVADVYVNNPRQIHLFGKDFGEATVFATSASGAVVFSTTVRVAQNLTSIDRMIKVAMPDADIQVTTVGQIAVLNGTVKSPQDSEQAQRLVTSLLNPGVNGSDPNAQVKIAVINRLKTATPLQVQLQVKFAEVSRSFVKNIGVNFTTKDSTGGFQFGLAQGRSPGSFTAADLAKYPVATMTQNGVSITGAYDPSTGQFLNPRASGLADITRGSDNATMGLAGKLFGLDVLSAIDIGETIGQVTTLANPNLTARSGETANFLAGGEIPIPVAQGLGTTTVEYKQYGISLAFTPTVLSDGRISLRVRPEVSQLTSAGAVQLNGVTIPALSTRRSETTVELGSGESMVIGGLLQNSHNNTVTKTPGLGDVPVLGALFRSNGFQRNETELVIVITPYLVKPVNANQIVLPTDGYRAPNDLERVLLGSLSGKDKTNDRPKPSMAPADGQPAVGAFSPAPTNQPVAPVQVAPAPTNNRKQKKGGSAAPGFGF
ncbi:MULTISPECIES: type II and III secretion system protein family protein [unclassified Sphingomonas]|uniref:type II and III secretion system protein family protein n=1 Tax=unclassified Sphingomonas TaxID=196159 RepID=UPI0022B37AE4|nr:type II and III secretion system protein family protein [Sphingomonas sp. NIBR02145]WHU00829.1 type II and III secretion system protein family protein [Sphingomonas sp. NIBR02145]